MNMRQKRPPGSAPWTDRLRAALPSRDMLVANPWLKPIAHRLLDPQLWRLQHEAVARGVAIGIFWAFSIPFGQIPVAAAHSVWWRANIPVAVGATLVTNPFTIGFWLWLAYRLGSLLLGTPPLAPIVPTEGSSLQTLLITLGEPVILGMGIFAVAGSAAGYVGVKLVWRLRVWLKRRSR